jgi:tetraacyldisaccharide 4'-kinase
MPEGAISQLWESSALGARFVRGALMPASWMYAAAVAARNAAYNHGWLRSRELTLPAISVGNLTVGGTGKTPVSAFMAARLAELGLNPAIVMRGYGSDESLVHARLNPGIPVVIAADRVRGVAEARAMGRNVAVLDDAFQHRRAKRDADIVLISADLAGPVRLLPAGPWREPVASLARASFIIVTRKSASPVRARELLAHARRFAPLAGTAIIHLAADRIVSCLSGELLDVAALRGKAVLAVAAIGDPRAFSAQLREMGARVDLVAERDHHAYSAGDAAALARRAASADFVICTLKDAVKLGPLWPREAPSLWYLSQRVVVESGAAELDDVLATLAVAKPTI